MADAPQVAYADVRPEVHREASPPEVSQYHQVPLLKQGIHAYYDDAHAQEAHVPVQAPATILGIRRRNFWILIVIAAVIVTATIGGSVGGSMAIRDTRAKSEAAVQQIPTPTAAQVTPTGSAPTGTAATTASSHSASPTSYIPIPAASVALIDISCPSSTAPPLRSFNDKRYGCAQGKGIIGNDITGISAYSLQQCIDACSTFNTRPGSTKCAAVVLNPDLAESYIINNGANCWLKEKAAPVFSYTPTNAGGTVAILNG